MATTKTGRGRSTQRRRNAKTSGDSAAGKTSGQFRCPDCGRTFDRPQSLGAHRRQAHGVAGNSKRSQSRAAAASRGAAQPRRSAQSTPSATTRGRRSGEADNGSRSGGGSALAATVNRDALLRALFPHGIPAREDVLRDVNGWLDEAERLARSR